MNEFSVIRVLVTCHLSSAYDKTAKIRTEKKNREFHVNLSAFKVLKLFLTIAKGKRHTNPEKIIGCTG